MASQEVRYYLNGLLVEYKDGEVNAVATDGHRLALATSELDKRNPIEPCPYHSHNRTGCS